METDADACPSAARAFYSRVPFVYTWANGSVPGYAAARAEKGGQTAVRGHIIGHMRATICR